MIASEELTETVPYPITRTFTYSAELAFKPIHYSRVFVVFNPVLQRKSIGNMHITTGLELNIPLDENFYAVATGDLQFSSLENTGNDSTYFYPVHFYLGNPCDFSDDEENEQCRNNLPEQHVPTEVTYKSTLMSSGLLLEFAYETDFYFLRGGAYVRNLTYNNTITFDNSTLKSNPSTFLYGLNLKAGVAIASYADVYLSVSSILYSSGDAFDSEDTYFIKAGVSFNY